MLLKESLGESRNNEGRLKDLGRALCLASWTRYIKQKYMYIRAKKGF